MSFISRRDPALGETVQMRDSGPEVPTSMPVIAGGEVSGTFFLRQPEFRRPRILNLPG
jgi:hypothetical protein